ncbi:MAG: DUF3868 domain-containing protein [Tannerellaceae bacterium]|jgi:hypothetical protein|nr:DUF3868 domain-containing protein [Tannerellaceae bacterium]
MKTLIYATIAGMMLLLTMTATAQQPSVRVNKAQVQNNVLDVDMDIRLPYIDVKRNESLYLTLLLRENTSNARKQTQRLPAIVIHGGNTKHMYDRSVALLGEKVAKEGAYVVLKNDKDLIQFVPFRGKLRYRPWMQNCQLILVSEVKNYKKQRVSGSAKVISRQLIR